MKSINRQTTTPVNHPKTRRPHAVIVGTSMPAGKMVPIASIPMLREDAAVGSVDIRLEMAETAELLLNPVKARVMAFVVPWLAMERFEGSRDQFDRSYAGEPQVEGGDVVPFFETHAMGTHGSKAVYKYLGEHGKSTDNVNTMLVEAYNAIWNYRATNRSKELTKRDRLDATLAPAFWPSSRFAHIVPDFDMAAIDGQIPLSVVNTELELRNTDLGGSLIDENHARIRFYDNAGDLVTPTVMGLEQRGSGTDGGRALRSSAATANPGVGDRTFVPRLDLRTIIAELAEDGVTLSLANFELAKKTQHFARVRERYDGIEDDYIIDMFMSGLHIPDQNLKSPILIADQMVDFSQVKRHATDGDNLEMSAVSGAAQTKLRIRVPRLETGGVIMIVAEAVPEQLFERQRNPFLHLNAVDKLPEYMRDFLDTQKVEEVYNRDIDTDHATPDGVFGYAPLNWPWAAAGPRMGGKFYRPTIDTTEDEDRQRLWAVEAVNPVLAEDFYVVSEIHDKPFLTRGVDPFEVFALGQVQLTGLTVFGRTLLEATGNYDAVLEKAPTEQIEQD